MSETYGNSKLTIVAVSGHNTNAGLPGTRPNTRNLAQSHETVKNIELSLSLPTLRTVLKTAPWATRGWTYQEGVLSPRCLILSASQVYWECGSTSRCESMQDLPDLQRVTRTTAEPSTALLTNPFHEEQPSPFTAYAHVVKQYAARRLTYASDALHAISGVFRDQTSYTFCWGLPKEDFAAALLWWPLGDMKRREGFPSWSWAGWEGQVWYDMDKLDVQWDADEADPEFVSRDRRKFKPFSASVVAEAVVEFPVEEASQALHLRTYRAFILLDWGVFDWDDEALGVAELPISLGRRL